jgi:LPS-assembly lipoprotein
VLSAVAILSALVLVGCAGGEGFRPMYAPTASGVGVQERMKSIDVTPIGSRVGQKIRNELIFQTTGGGLPDKPEYRLDITIREALNSTLVKPNGEALGQIYTLEAAFRLTRLSDKKIVMEGTSYGRAGFERFQQIYSNVRARQDAENRAATTVADDIKTRLAAALSSSRI